MTKTCIIIAGPTASGKTALSLELARRYNTEIISADSRQCYREMTIGVAKPSLAELSEVNHYFINSHSIQAPVTAAAFERYALESIQSIFGKSDTAVMVGGTGLYIKAFCEGLDEIPFTDPSIREQINKQYEERGLAWLQAEVKEKDPLFYSSGEILNPHRLMRSLEVMMSTGKSIRSFQKQQKLQRDFRIIKYGTQLPKELLVSAIDKRVESMIDQGLVEEVRALVPYRQLIPLQTVGYSEIFDYLDDKISLNEAINLVKIHTRQYAKRQLTWFKKDPEIKWIDPRDNCLYACT
jgi:tRNA dimethylallyltransferase